MAKFIELEVNPFHNPHKCLVNVDWIVDIFENVNDANTCFVYFAVKTDDTSCYELVSGSFESLKKKLESL